jgi:LysR family hydrogen peroxide-inducible transcriptional activator
MCGLSLRDLEYLDAVARQRHFGRAASECGVSQPALSAQIKKLESVIGIQVFERSPRRVLVTARGEEVLVRTRNILREAQALFDQGRDQQASLSGPFRIGALPTLGPYLLPSLIEPLRQAWPKLNLIISEDLTDALVEGLRTGTFDAILLCRHAEDSALSFQHLFFEPFVVLHQPARPAEWPIEAADSPVILLKEGHCLRGQVHDACGRDHVYCARNAQSLEMLRFMVAAGEGVSLVPALAARALERADGLTASSPIPDAAVGRDVVLATRRSDRRKAYIEHLITLIRSLVPALMQEARPER